MADNSASKPTETAKVNGDKNTAPIILQSQPDFVENTKFNPLSVAFLIVQAADSTIVKQN